MLFLHGRRRGRGLQQCKWRMIGKNEETDYSHEDDDQGLKILLVVIHGRHLGCLLVSLGLCLEMPRD